jgi:hypothetical protein
MSARRKGNTIVDTRYTYDPLMDPSTWRGYRPRARPGTLKYVSAIGKISANRRKNKVGMPQFSFSEPKPQHPNQLRIDAEQRMVERINKCIDLLQWGMTEINEAPTPRGQYQSLVYTKRIVDIIEALHKAIVANRNREKPPIILEGDM